MTSETTSTKVLHTALLKLLRPLVSLLIKKGVSYKTFADLTKWLFYDVAKTEFTIPGRKQTLSRIGVLTGLSRKDVRHLSQVPLPINGRRYGDQYNRGIRVISGWYRDERCLDKRGRPKSIPITGGEGSFDSLVKRYSGDMPTRAVLDELTRIGALKVTAKNRVRLMKDAFVPNTDDEVKFNILGTDVGLLISTIDHNLDPDREPPFFQRKVNYNNLPAEALPQLREIAAQRAGTLLNVIEKELANKDRDVNPETAGTGRFEAGIGIYYFERPYSDES